MYKFYSVKYAAFKTMYINKSWHKYNKRIYSNYDIFFDVHFGNGSSYSRGFIRRDCCRNHYYCGIYKVKEKRQRL